MSPRGWKGFLGLLLLGALAVVFTTTGPAAGRGSAAAPPDGPGSGRWQRLGSSPLTAPTTPPAILTPTPTPIPWDDILVTQDGSGGNNSNESLGVHGPYVYVVVDFSPGDEVRFIRSTDGGWTFEPSRLLATPGFLSSLSMRPSAGQNGADALYVVFQNNDQRVYCMRSLDGGATWSAPALVRQGQGHWPDLAKVVADDAGVLYVAWYEDVDDYGGYFYVSSSTDGGITFSPPVQVNPERRQFLRTWAAYTLAPWQNTLYFAYVDLPPTPGFNIMFTRSTDGGQTWSPPVRVDDSGISDKYGVDLAVDAAGVLYVAWDDNREYGGGHLLTRVARSTDGGATWSPGVRVDDAGDCVEGSTSGAIAVDGGTVSLHVALWDGRNYCREPYYLGWDDVFYTCSTDGGRTWSRNEQISNPVPYNIIWFPSIQTWDGVVYTLFAGHGAGWLWLDIHDPHLPPVTMTPTPTPTDTPTPSPPPTDTSVPTATPTPTNTPPPTSTPRPTVTTAPSATPTATPRPTVPATPAATATPSPSPGLPGWRVCLPWVERR